jgi:hypothetical protein
MNPKAGHSGFWRYFALSHCSPTEISLSFDVVPSAYWVQLVAVATYQTEVLKRDNTKIVNRTELCAALWHMLGTVKRVH